MPTAGQNNNSLQYTARKRSLLKRNYFQQSNSSETQISAYPSRSFKLNLNKITFSAQYLLDYSYFGHTSTISHKTITPTTSLHKLHIIIQNVQFTSPTKSISFSALDIEWSEPIRLIACFSSHVAEKKLPSAW